MRKITLSFVALLFSLSLLAEPINFNKGDWSDVLKQAKESNKLIFVDAYATWCGPCKMMDQNVFAADEVGEFYNETFVNFKIDMESEAGLVFDETYPVTAYPTMFFINPDGEIVKKLVGYREVENFLNVGRWVKDPTSAPSYELSKQYATGDRSQEFLKSYIDALNEEGEDVSHLIDAYFQTLPGSALEDEDTFILFYQNATDINYPATEYFLVNINTYLNIYGDELMNEKVFSIIDANIIKAANNQDDDTFEKLLVLIKPIFLEDKWPEFEERLRGYYAEMKER
ncbi:thioredoxin family protein [Penaeicola halotolerans]|uniref:thioredoxin family protein n=1 Tax=Penaeicola halotolerans TaxID=2793196 RepID=UPI001CF9110D|nr:thioredoxin family protein [Penaeicola halotolerans]